MEVVSDNVVTTWFDENLISALKRALPSELVTITGKVRGAVGPSTQELREGAGVFSNSIPVKSACDPTHEGMGVAVRMEWKISAGGWKLVLQVKMGLGQHTRRGRGRFYDILSERDDRDERDMLTFNQVNIAA